MSSTNYLSKLPVAPLKILSLDGSLSIATKVNSLIVNARQSLAHEHKNLLSLYGYDKENYLVHSSTPRFNSGEAKGQIYETIRGSDVYIIADIINHSIHYQLNEHENMVSPDDQFQNLKRLIDACNGKAHRINVIIPFLYEGRQNTSNNQESLDCATALTELVKMGVKNIITFDAHDPRVENAIPKVGFDNFFTSYQFIQALLANEKGLSLDSDHLMIISPTENGMSRAIFYANILGVDVGMFYGRNEYSKLNSDGNPSVIYEYLGSSVEGKSVFIIDDMIDSGEGILKIVKELRKRKASKIYIAATFGLFTIGYDRFDEFYAEGLFDRIYTTNLTYCSPELLQKPYYINVDLSRYLALIIHTINHDKSVEGILNSVTRIQDIVAEYKENNK
jgi:ribose-phosphate pyrophosphokinase